MTRAIFSLALTALVLQHGTPILEARQTGDALSFFKNYFITGDYVVGGVGVNGNGQGTTRGRGRPGRVPTSPRRSSTGRSSTRTTAAPTPAAWA